MIGALAACGHAAPVDPPANRATPPAPDVTHLVVMVVPGYDHCGVVHHIDVTLDGTLATTLEVNEPCPPSPQTINGHTIYVTDSGATTFRAKPFDVAPGHHVFVAKDRETGRGDTFSNDFPAYDATGPDHRPLGEMGVRVDEMAVKCMGLAHELVTM